eukprot:TRINITY_DN208_c0_g1_i3.p1 TRINITY_DN208_c0_g1~~TRINITY_DN208_c0_g1_i3.p1  ORF type:complete len:280 (+),score=57.66 TRINITY_DN208_c0_g1_i3:83-922(+)
MFPSPDYWSTMNLKYLTKSGQVGGHGGSKEILFHDDKVLKPTGPNKELDFYELVRKGEVVALNNILPTYYGCEMRSTEWGVLRYMVLQNTTYGMKHPSVCDLKMGTQTWDEECTGNKKQRHIDRDINSTSTTFGIRFCGMKVYNSKTKTYEKFPRYFGWDARDDEEKLQLSVERYLDNGYGVQTYMIPTWLTKLDKIKEFLELGTWKFYTSSLLLAYDDNTDGPQGRPAQCHMIDFAHSWRTREGEKDVGYLTGIETLVRLFNKILAKYPPSIQDYVLL